MDRPTLLSEHELREPKPLLPKSGAEILGVPAQGVRGDDEVVRVRLGERFPRLGRDRQRDRVGVLDERVDDALEQAAAGLERLARKRSLRQACLRDDLGELLRRCDGSAPERIERRRVDRDELAARDVRARAHGRIVARAPCRGARASSSRSSLSAHASMSCIRTWRWMPSSHARRSRLGSPIARSSAAAWPSTSSGSTGTTHSASSSNAPASAGEDEHAVALVDERRLLRDEVEPVHHGVHEQHVVLEIGRDGGEEVVAHHERDRRPIGPREPLVDLVGGALDRGAVVHVFGNLLARGVEQREQPDASFERRHALEQAAERLEAPDRVLRGVGAIDAEHKDLRAFVRERFLPLADTVAGDERVELLSVHGDGIRMRDALGIPAPIEQGATAVDEGGAPVLGVEAGAVAREQPFVDRVGDVAREHRPRVRTYPGDVREVRDACLGPRCANEGRHEVEVVVLDEDRRVRRTVELLDDGRRERPVGLDIPLAPGRGEVGPRMLLQLPQTVLDEPQHGVRDHAVKQAVYLGVVGHQAQRVRRARRRLLRPPPGSGDLALDLAHCARDPHHVVPVDQRAQRGDEAAGAAGLLDCAARATPEADRPAVRDDDQRLAPGHYPDEGRLPSVTGIDTRFLPRSTVNVTVWPGRRVVVTSLDTSSASSTFVPAIATIRSPPRVTSWPLKASVREPP